MSIKARSAAALLLAGGFVASEALAVVGRPLTPVSYAGVARRTARRGAYYGGYGYGGAAPVAAAATAVAVGATVASLPAGCPLYGGIYRCGGYAYRPVYDGPNVVYVIEND
jgi:hypothetical protein